MQPLFDSRFPHGKNQWISAGATSWATMAMILAVPKFEQLQTKNDVVDTVGTPKALSPNLQIDFQKDISPLIQRSCLGCHSGANPKANLRVDSLANLIQGGESGTPAVVPSKPEESPIYLYPAGKVEDMEMPPLHARNKYRALSKKEVELLRNWIQQGAVWPKETDPKSKAPLETK